MHTWEKNIFLATFIKNLAKPQPFFLFLRQMMKYNLKSQVDELAGSQCQAERDHSAVLVSLCFCGHFLRLNLLNDLSADATVAGRQQKMRNEILTLMKISSRLRWANLFNKVNGSNFFDPIFELWILFSCITSWSNFSSETSVDYILATFVDAERISSSLMSGYSHKNLNMLLICLAASNLVLSPAITQLRMGRKTFLRNFFSGSSHLLNVSFASLG